MRAGRFSAYLGVILVAMSLTVTAVADSGDPPDLAPGGTFLDDDWTFAEGAIEAITAEGIVNGCALELYCPERTLIRAEAAALIARILKPAPAHELSFPDVDPDAWYAADVTSLAGVGVITGHEDGTYRPDDPLTRAQMAQLLVRAFPDMTLTFEPIAFVDVPPQAAYARAVTQLSQSGVTTGCATSPARYCPHEPVHRDQMAMFLTRILGLDLLVPPTRLAPLNGEPIRGLDWARRVVAVKIDDHRGARPQSGMGEADAMIETLVEGGLTRWIGLFHQSDSSYVGPVRSMRPTDTGLVIPLGATVAASGGQPWILDQAAAEGVFLIREKDADGALFRISERKAPHDLYGDTNELREVADKAGFPDRPYRSLFKWGSLPTGQAAAAVDLVWSDPITVTWSWDGNVYRRWRYGAAHEWVSVDGLIEQIWADTLLVITAPVSEVWPPPGVSGSPVPSLATVGQGQVLVFAGGQIVRGRWQRNSWLDPFELTTVSGDPLLIPPGRTWINVFPEGQPIRY